MSLSTFGLIGVLFGVVVVLGAGGEMWTITSGVNERDVEEFVR